MARIRTIKPEFFRHYDLYKLEQETGLPVRLAFAGLWTVCDREGRFKWVPEELKIACLPYDQCDFSRVLDALVSRDFVVIYESNGRRFGCVPTFNIHQVINNRESQSVLPDPYGEGSEIIGLGNTSRVIHASSTREVHAQVEGKEGREGKGSAKKQKVSIAAADMRADFPELTDQVISDYLELRKSKKAPLTKTAWSSIANEIRKSGIPAVRALTIAITKGWQGLEAEWLINAARAVTGTPPAVAAPTRASHKPMPVPPPRKPRPEGLDLG